MSAHGYFLAGLECVICVAMLALWWLSGGFPALLFMAGAAAGAGLVMGAITFERQRALREEIRMRLNA